MGHFGLLLQVQCPEGPRIEKNQSREAILKKSSFQYGMKISIENEIFIPGPSLTAEKQGPGLKFSIENEIFKPRMKISSENENFVRGGMVFSCVRARMNFFNPGALWVYDSNPPCRSLITSELKASAFQVQPESSEARLFEREEKAPTPKIPALLRNDLFTKGLLVLTKNPENTLLGAVSW